MDVINNYEKIIKGMKLGSFTEIMNKYYNNFEILIDLLDKNSSEESSSIYESLNIDIKRVEEVNGLLQTSFKHINKTLNS